ncbi:hypothetical protein NDU88_001539 [Pleurodeles waltl]|uniref:Uncharacterized protein n=1 Tax=Pleurodeles waltl TaxID=8319 RepID=A0AAV7W1C2_PLEWA|nr:hypothetical protein NDU88_001539 [Pleurodeles waltl]
MRCFRNPDSSGPLPRQPKPAGAGHAGLIVAVFPPCFICRRCHRRRGAQKCYAEHHTARPHCGSGSPTVSVTVGPQRHEAAADRAPPAHTTATSGTGTNTALPPLGVMRLIVAFKGLWLQIKDPSDPILGLGHLIFNSVQLSWSLAWPHHPMNHVLACLQQGVDRFPIRAEEGDVVHLQRTLNFFLCVSWCRDPSDVRVLPDVLCE